MFLKVDLEREQSGMKRESRTIKGLAASMTVVVMVPSVVSGQTYYEGAPDYSVVGSVTDPNRDTTETVYDGIGTVTPLPGGTSVLERVLYQVEQLKVSSPGAMAPVNGIYANIAESVLQREWYTTDRLEQEFVPVTEYFNTITEVPAETETLSLTVSNLYSLLGDGTISTTTQIEDPQNPGSTVSISDVSLGTMYVYQYENEFGASFLQQIELGSGESFSYVDTYGRVVVDSDGNVTVEDGNFFPGTGSDEFFVVIDLASGERILFDTLSNLQYERLGEFGINEGPLAGQHDLIPWEEDQLGNFTELAGSIYDDSNGGTAGLGDILTDYSIVFDGGSAIYASSAYIAANGLADAIPQVTYETSPAYTIYETTEVLSTLTENSFYDDWWQRELSTTIDGSVTNIISGVGAATEAATAAAVPARSITLPTIDIGDIATTALGAVNTGDITVGVNSALDETAASTTRAIQASLIVVGGSEDTGTMMLNIAHNTSIIRGNVDNTLIAVNGSVGDISTTALGAVNTGTITNGVNAAVQGIVGLSGVN